MTPPTPEEPVEIDLREPWIAALLAWAIPGAGHFYQRRYAKALLFFICILTTYFYGLSLGGGHVVYASWTKTDRRWQYVLQAGAGAVTLPAVIQNRRVMAGEEPLIADVLAPPEQPVLPNDYDELAEWHRKYGHAFELGTLYTVIAGLLNFLAIYDAYCGPYFSTPEEEHLSRKKKKKSDQPGEPGKEI